MRITRQKEVLLTTLEENRAKHEIAFNTAAAEYNDLILKLLDVTKKKVLAGDTSDWIRSLQQLSYAAPKSNISSYDNAISAIRWTDGETVELTMEDYHQFVLDNWEWRKNFLANNQLYQDLKSIHGLDSSSIVSEMLDTDD